MCVDGWGEREGGGVGEGGNKTQTTNIQDRWVKMRERQRGLPTGLLICLDSGLAHHAFFREREK